jgi:hypothetical protein
MNRAPFEPRMYFFLDVMLKTMYGDVTCAGAFPTDRQNNFSMALNFAGAAKD